MSRPEKMSGTNIQTEAAAVRETDDLYRLYRTEWVIAHTVSGQGDMSLHVPAEPFVMKARDWAASTFGGRVPDADIRLQANTDGVDAFWVHVQVRKPNLKGEFKHPHLAANHAEKQAWAQYEVVSRNSKRDHELRNYGVKLQG